MRAFALTAALLISLVPLSASAKTIDIRCDYDKVYGGYNGMSRNRTETYTIVDSSHVAMSNGKKMQGTITSKKIDVSITHDGGGVSRLIINRATGKANSEFTKIYPMEEGGDRRTLGYKGFQAE